MKSLLVAVLVVLASLTSSLQVGPNRAAAARPVPELIDPRQKLAAAAKPKPSLVASQRAADGAHIAIRSTGAASSGDIMVSITVQYPSAGLPTGATLGIRGSNPLSWTETIPLTGTNTPDEWSVSFPVSGVNATYPTWAVDTKVVVETATLMVTKEGKPITFGLPANTMKKESTSMNNQGVKSAASNIIWMLGCNHRFTLKVTEPTANTTIWPWFTTDAGVEVTLNNVHSPQLNNNRSVWLYIPPGSVENPYRYERNVNVFQDGQNLAPLWNVPEHLNTHIMDETMESLFIIGPYNMDANRTYEYTYAVDPFFGGGGGDIYLDFVEDTLVPLIATMYNIKTEQENLGILGSSLGGLIACYAGVTRPQVYSKIGCMSSSFWWAYDNFRKTIVPQLTSVNARTQVYYIDSGDSGPTDDGRGETSLVTSMFARFGTYGPESSSASDANGNPTATNENFVLGTNLFYYLQRGGHHNEYFWSKRLHHPLQWIYFRDAIWNTPEPG